MNVEVFGSLRQVFREKEPECSGEQWRREIDGD